MAREAPELRFPAGCRRWACSVCGPLKAQQRAEILAWAEPERFVTLTQPAPTSVSRHVEEVDQAEWQRLRQRVRKLALTLRSAGHHTEWAWTVERGKKNGMVHVHLLQHGGFLPQRQLQAAWGYRVDVRRIGSATGAAGYAMKEARRVAGYAMKAGSAALDQHLALNGGRGCHYSRGYLRGKRTADVWKLLHPPDESHTWVLVPQGVDLPDHLRIR